MVRAQGCRGVPFARRGFYAKLGGFWPAKQLASAQTASPVPKSPASRFCESPSARSKHSPSPPRPPHFSHSRMMTPAGRVPGRQVFCFANGIRKNNCIGFEFYLKNFICRSLFIQTFVYAEAIQYFSAVSFYIASFYEAFFRINFKSRRYSKRRKKRFMSCAAYRLYASSMIQLDWPPDSSSTNQSSW